MSRGSSVSPRPELLFSAGGFLADRGPSVTAAAACMADAAAALLAAIVASNPPTVEPEGAVVWSCALDGCVVAVALDDDRAPLSPVPSGKRHAVSV